MLEHTVLMDAGFVGEGVGADDGLVGLHREAGDVGHQPRSRDDLSRVDIRRQLKNVAAGAHRHHDFFQRGVAGPLAQTVDGAFHLPRPGQHRRQRVGHRQPQVVMTMDRKNGFIGVRHPFDQAADGVGELLGNVVADGVGDIDGARARLDHRLGDPAQEVEFGATGVLGGEFHVVGPAPGAAHGFDRPLQHLIRLQP